MSFFIPSSDDGEQSELPNGEIDEQPFIFNVPEENEDEAAKLKERLEQTERENAALKAAQAVNKNIPSFEEGYRPPQTASAPQVTQPPPGFDQATLNKQIETDLFSGNALGVFQKFNAAAVELAEQRAMQKLIPMQAAIVKQNVNFFKQTANMEPEVAKEFDKMVKQYSDQDLANVDVSALPDILTNMKRLAFAKAYEEGYVPAAQRRAPMYGGPSGGGPSSLQRGQKAMKLTPRQQEAVRIAREEYGWDDKMIYTALQNGDLNG